MPMPEYLDAAEAQGLIQRLHRPDGTAAQLVAAGRGDGTSSLARDLLLAAAHRPGWRSLLLDPTPPGTAHADWLRARLPATAAMQLGPGYAALVGAGASPPAWELSHLDAVEPGLWPRLLPDLRTAFDLVLIDSPALETSYDAIALAPAVDCSILVVAAETTATAAVRALRDRIFEAGGAIAGMILNRRRERLPHLLRRLF